MPTEEENVQYLYLVLTAGGPPNIDTAAISKVLNLSAGAVSKRWSRLKQAIEGGKNPGPSAYQFLWLCVKHSTRDKALDWADIAAKCGTTSGAASKRYSRMKQAFERGDAAPTTPSKPKNGVRADTSSPAGNTPTPMPKRKRATPKKKTADDDDDDEDFAERKPKRVTKPRATPNSKQKRKRTPAVKEEPKDQSAGFLISNRDVDGNVPGNSGGNHLLTPTHSGSVNPTEATTLIKSDPDIPNPQLVGVQDPTYGTGLSEHGDEFYDAQEEAVFDDEEATTQDRIQEWLGEI